MGKIVLYIAVSKDFYIATKDDDLSWLDQFHVEGTDFGYSSFISTCSTTVMGKKTYDFIKSFGGDFPYPNQKNYVFTRSEGLIGNDVTFITSDFLTESNNVSLLTEKGNCFLIGGNEIVKLFFQHQLIDEIILSVMPVTLGDGKALFDGSIPKDFELIKEDMFPLGIKQLTYKNKKG